MSFAGVGKNINAINQIAKTQPQVLQAIKHAASKTGVDFAYLVHKAGVESSFNPNAKASTSSASGLFQFVKGTWLDMIDRHGANYGLGNEAAAIQRRADGRLTVNDKATRERILALRNNPHVAAAMAAEYAAENTEALRQKVGGKIGATEMYLAHFLGSEGAGDLLNAMKARPNAPAAALLPQAASANKNVFYTDGGRARTVSEIYANFAAKFKDEPAAPDTKGPRVQTAAVGITLPAAMPHDAQPPVPQPVESSMQAQLLAVITPEKTFDVAELRAENNTMQLASLNPLGVYDIGDSINSVVASDNLFRAMQFAAQLLDSSDHLSQRQDPSRERASRQYS